MVKNTSNSPVGYATTFGDSGGKRYGGGAGKCRGGTEDGRASVLRAHGQAWGMGAGDHLV